ncbi:MAG: phosphatase PAP2 family protein [Pseudobdellovibrionaceae bacterium]
MVGNKGLFKRLRTSLIILLSIFTWVAHSSNENSDPVLQWNQIAIDVIRGGGDKGPGFPSRNMAIMHAAIFDTVNAIKPTAESYLYHQEAPHSTNLEIAVAGAASATLVALYPAEKNLIMSRVLLTLSQVQRGHYKNDPSKILNDPSFNFGENVASVILASRQNDGSDVETPYNPTPAPGVWVPTLPDFTPAWGPAWGMQKLFIISDRYTYLPPPPPALTSSEYSDAVNEVEALGKTNSTVRTTDQTLTALFWSLDTSADGSPITLYNEALQVISRQQKNSTLQNARLFALANLAMADAGIVCWLSKYDYILWRPVQAIRMADEDGNSMTTPDPAWLPLGFVTSPFIASTMTPPFPSYVSGHSTFGAALFETLRQFYHKDSISFSLTSRDTPGLVRSYPSFSAAEAENGRSRIFMGVHYRFDNLNGLALGESVAKEVISKIPLLKMKNNTK